MAGKIQIRDTDALIAVDLQNDFLPGGSLGVNHGDEVIPVINALVPRFKTVVFSRDWHPEGHMSFSDQPEFVDKSWPGHCVQGTFGAEFHKDIKIPETAMVVSKATDPEIEQYSAFDVPGLSDDLKKRGVTRVMVGGLATDYCVKFTVLGAIERGFEAVMIEDASRGVDVPPGSAAKAVLEMKAAGAVVVSSADIE